MDNKIFDRALTLTDFFKVFIKRLWIILLAVVIGVASTFTLEVFHLKKVKQVYESETILRLPQNGPMVDGSSTELSLINDFYRIIDSTLVLNTVYESMDFSGDDGITYEDFRERIYLIQHSDSRIIRIKVEWDDEEIAKKISDKICTEGLKNIKASLDESEMNAMMISLECNTRMVSPERIKASSLLKNALIMGVGFGAAIYLVFIVIFWLDNKVREDDDLESSIGVGILGTVPNEDMARKMTGGHYDRILSDKMNKQKSEENK